jgi:hypothetical protein
MLMASTSRILNEPFRMAFPVLRCIIETETDERGLLQDLLSIICSPWILSLGLRGLSIYKLQVTAVILYGLYFYCFISKVGNLVPIMTQFRTRNLELLGILFT